MCLSEDYIRQNKAAWEYNAYEFWTMTSGTPEERAKMDLENPEKMLRRYAEYFDSYQGIKVANICGSCGKKAVPLALLGAEVTIFDISEENRRYAMEVARAAHTAINYEVCNILEIDPVTYGNFFDVILMEGGILHYFHDINEFMQMMYAILKPGGKMICSDFHPFNKIMDTLKFGTPSMDYFSDKIYEGEMAHARFFKDEIRRRMPKCSYRKYTISEIINAIIRNGFCLKQFDEHPSWENSALPGEFTAVAKKPEPTGVPMPSGS